MIDITTIIQAIIALIAAVITTFLIPWLKSKMNEQQWNTMTSAIVHAVQAAEQLFDCGQGQQKKQYVLNYLESKGITADDTIIESTVNSYFGKASTIASELNETN